jgi:hypothetical protein
MSAGHTPGPWTVSDLYADDMGHPELSITAKVNGKVCHPAAVCLQFPRMEGMQMANARLIASAPDLLAERDRLQALNAELAAALNEVRSDLWLQIEPKHGTQAATNYPSIVRARAALEKHQGEAK